MSWSWLRLTESWAYSVIVPGLEIAGEGVGCELFLPTAGEWTKQTILTHSHWISKGLVCAKHPAKHIVWTIFN